MRAALIQSPPVFLNLGASVERGCRLVTQAADEGAELVVFPETWLPGYPMWLDDAPGAVLWDDVGAKRLFAALRDNSPSVDGPEIEAFRAAARDAGVEIVIGINERDGNTLYNNMLFIDRNGETASHRKLVPTYTERLVWGRGDGSTLATVQAPWGVLGGLICWEHWMPLARAAMHAKHEVVHVAQWPWVKEMHMIASRHYAFEGRCFVLASGSLLTRGDVLEGLDALGPEYAAAREVLDGLPGDDDRLLLRAGSAAIGPDGSILAGPDYDTAETVYADLDPGTIADELMTLDTDGHYSRPDVFNLTVDTAPHRGVVFGAD